MNNAANFAVAAAVVQWVRRLNHTVAQHSQLGFLDAEALLGKLNRALTHVNSKHSVPIQHAEQRRCSLGAWKPNWDFNLILQALRARPFIPMQNGYVLRMNDEAAGIRTLSLNSTSQPILHFFHGVCLAHNVWTNTNTACFKGNDHLIKESRTQQER